MGSGARTGPGFGVEDTLSGTVDIDGVTDTQKNLIVFLVRGGNRTEIW